ncbi:hypothetical protein V6Z11_A01G115000 [Gossypium hirsutum]
MLSREKMNRGEISNVPSSFSTMDQLNSKCQLLPTDGPHFFPGNLRGEVLGFGCSKITMVPLLTFYKLFPNLKLSKV